MDKLKLKFDIIKTKLLIFMAIAGGSWIYTTQNKENIIVIESGLLFLLSSIAIGNNLAKLGELERKIDE
jgi:hypothetical protein